MTETTTRKRAGRPRKTAAQPVPQTQPASEGAREPMTAAQLRDALAVLADAGNPAVTLRLVDWEAPNPAIAVYNVVDVMPSGTLLWQRYTGEK